jgi:aminoglycoside phosphotransferase (APT) family kinase protein
MGEDFAALSSALGLHEQARWTQLRAHRGKSIWRVDTPDRIYAVRILRAGDRESAEHEVEMMRLAREAGLPVAAVVTSSRLGDRPLVLLDWTPGRELNGEIEGRPWAARRLGAQFAAQQARMHGVQSDAPPDVGWINCFGPVDEPLFERLSKAQSRSALIHLDFYPANLVYISGSISGILDWTNARFGDPRADIARTWALLNLVFRSGRRHPVRRLSGDAFARSWWRHIAAPQDDLEPFLAWATAGLIGERMKQATALEHRRALANLVSVESGLRERAGLPPVAGRKGLAAGASARADSVGDTRE